MKHKHSIGSGQCQLPCTKQEITNDIRTFMELSPKVSDMTTHTCLTVQDCKVKFTTSNTWLRHSNHGLKMQWT